MPRSRIAVSLDVAMAILTVASLVLVLVEDGETDPARRATLLQLDAVLVFIFLVEWLARAARAPRPLRWAVGHSWELLGMIPLALPLPEALRFLRVTRLVRLLRLIGSVGRLFGVWERIARDSRIGQIGAVAGGITLLGALAGWLVERDAPGTQMALFGDALWWAAVTVATVGYGDVVPVTITGRFVAILLMVTGIGTIGILASSLAGVLIKQHDAEAGVARELERLAALHASGKLSDAEFQAAKAHALR